MKAIRIAAALVACAAAARADDKIGSARAPEVLKKVQAEYGKKAGMHVVEKVTVPGFGAGGSEYSFDGVVKKDFAALKGSAEVYCKGIVTLMRSPQGQFVEPRRLDPRDAAAGAAVKNPALVVATLLRFASAATFSGEEKLGELECKIASTAADPKTMEEQLREILRNVQVPKEAGSMDLSQFADKKQSSSSYRAWVGKEDLLMHRIEWTLSVVIDRRKIPPGFESRIPEKLEVKYGLDFSKYDEDLDVEIPKEVKGRLGVK